MQEFNVRFPKRKPFDVVGFGLNAVDRLCVVPYYPRFNSKVPIKHHVIRCGGQVATAMITCARMGLTARYVGKVGSDELGQLSLRSIREEGVDTSSVLVEEGAYNQYAIIIVDERSGERTILWDRDPKLMYRAGELKREDVCSGRLLHIDGHDIEASIQAVAWAKTEGIPVSIDIDKVEERTEELIKDIDFLIGSSEFVAELTGIKEAESALRKLRKYNRCGFLCATLGVDGAMALIGDQILHSPGFKVQAVDTTGAGDAFHGAFIYGLFQNWTVTAILKFSNATAALNCTKIGARSGLPTVDQVTRFINEAEAKDGKVKLQSSEPGGKDQKSNVKGPSL